MTALGKYSWVAFKQALPVGKSWEVMQEQHAKEDAGKFSSAHLKWRTCSRAIMILPWVFNYILIIFLKIILLSFFFLKMLCIWVKSCWQIVPMITSVSVFKHLELFHQNNFQRVQYYELVINLSMMKVAGKANYLEAKAHHRCNLT